MHCAASPSPRRPRLELADIVREHGDALRRSHALSPTQAAVLRAIELCRTAALGGHLDVCDHCGYQAPSYNSCRNRHCPKCQGLAQAKWIAEREDRILPVRHFHVVFTVPRELHALMRYRSDLLFDALFASASGALLELGRDPKHLGADLGITAVLHTWTRELLFHPHVHCIVTGGGLSLDGARWVSTPRKFLFPVKVLGALLRGKLLDALRRAYARGDFAGFEDFRDPQAFDRLMQKLARKHWVVYAKRAFGGPQHVFRYLGRYTHRVGIANSRLVEMTDAGVTFRTKNGKAISLPPVEFLHRFLAHVLPPRFNKIRHYGLLAPANVPTKLARARELLSATEPVTLASPSAAQTLAELLAAPRICPVCRIGILRPRPLPSGSAPPPPVFDSS